MLKARASARRKAYITAMKLLMGAAAVLTCALVLFMIGYILGNGIPNITWEMLSTAPSYLANRVGILPDILSTLYIVIATLLIVLPLGVGAAIYLTEYAKNKKLVAVMEYAAETLSGIPSIIYGLVGMLVFCEVLGMGTSLLAGALTLAIMNLPTILRTTQESLKTVPQSYREGAFGLGAGKWRVVRTVVLPGCIDGVITGCILAVALDRERAVLRHEIFQRNFFDPLVEIFKALRFELRKQNHHALAHPAAEICLCHRGNSDGPGARHPPRRRACLASLPEEKGAVSAANSDIFSAALAMTADF